MMPQPHGMVRVTIRLLRPLPRPICDKTCHLVLDPRCVFIVKQADCTCGRCAENLGCGINCPQSSAGSCMTAPHLLYGMLGVDQGAAVQRTGAKYWYLLGNRSPAQDLTTTPAAHPVHVWMAPAKRMCCCSQLYAATFHTCSTLTPPGSGHCDRTRACTEHRHRPCPLQGGKRGARGPPPPPPPACPLQGVKPPPPPLPPAPAYTRTHTP
jgi:hypothetical protein